MPYTVWPHVRYRGKVACLHLFLDLTGIAPGNPSSIFIGDEFSMIFVVSEVWKIKCLLVVLCEQGEVPIGDPIICLYSSFVPEHLWSMAFNLPFELYGCAGSTKLEREQIFVWCSVFRTRPQATFSPANPNSLCLWFHLYHLQHQYFLHPPPEWALQAPGIQK